MVKITIVGATGYTGGELLRYLLPHPEAQVVRCTSESSAGQSIFSFYPAFEGRSERDWIMEKCDPVKIAKDTDLAFCCLPHGSSAKIVKKLLDHGVKVIDLSADFRFRSKAVYEKWYGKHPHPELFKEAVYGLSESYREAIREARLVANPGCYAATTILAGLPLTKLGLAESDSLIADAKSGVSGAGRKLESRYLFCEANENFLAYAVASHRHGPEIEQELSAGARKVSLTFVPHLLPITRGILVTLYATLKKKMSQKVLWRHYSEFYGMEPFVKVVPEGKLPDIKSVQFSNFCRIGVKVEERSNRAIIVAVTDNLGKGASGQAVQNMNLMFNLDERMGLV